MTLQADQYAKMTANQLALLTGKSYNTVKLLLVDLEHVSAKGRTFFYKPAQALAKIYGKEESERDRLERVRADQIEFDLAIKRGDYVSLSRVENALADWAHQLKSFFESIPKKIKHGNPKIRAREVKSIERELVKAQNRISAMEV